MRKLLLLVLLAGLLSGCAAAPAWETVEDLMPVEQAPAMKQISVLLPAEAAAPVFADGEKSVYQCCDYTLTQQILPGGDLSRSVKALSGMDIDRLQLLQTGSDGDRRWDFVWTSATEEGLCVGRACILEDGAYHYTLSAMAAEEKAGELKDLWQQTFASVCLTDEAQINTAA